MISLTKSAVFFRFVHIYWKKIFIENFIFYAAIAK